MVFLPQKIIPRIGSFCLHFYSQGEDPRTFDFQMTRNTLINQYILDIRPQIVKPNPKSTSVPRIKRVKIRVCCGGPKQSSTKHKRMQWRHEYAGGLARLRLRLRAYDAVPWGSASGKCGPPYVVWKYGIRNTDISRAWTSFISRFAY